MNNVRSEFINAIMISLKIEKNPYIVGTVSDFIKDVPQNKYKEFMSELFGNQHSFLNGLDRVAKVAEQFKPKDTDIIARAKRLIHFTESLNTQIGEEAKEKGEGFIYMVNCVKLPDKYNKTLAVMNLVKPHRSMRELIINIRRYQTSSEAINAFKQAIIEYEEMPIQDALIHNDVKKLIVPQKVYYDDKPNNNKI